jgi:hypothetical protein
MTANVAPDFQEYFVGNRPRDPAIGKSGKVFDAELVAAMAAIGKRN